MPKSRPAPKNSLERDVLSAIDRIESLRKQKGWTIEELASKAKGNFRSFNNWKQGHHVPTLAKLQPFAEAVEAELRFFVQKAGIQSGMTEEAAEVAEYINAIQDAELRVKVRDAIQRMIPVIESGHRSKKSG